MLGVGRETGAVGLARNARGKMLAGGFGPVRFKPARVDTTLTLPNPTLLYRSVGPRVSVVAVRSVTVDRDFGSTSEGCGGGSASDG